jgi:hypothetical protein
MATSPMVPGLRCQRAGITPTCGHSQRGWEREERASSHVGAGEPQLAQAILQGGALHPQAHYCAVRAAQYPPSLLQHLPLGSEAVGCVAVWGGNIACVIYCSGTALWA